MTSATDTHQPGRPRMKSRVPSIGSTHHIARHDSRSSLSAVSSDSHPASGTIAPSTAFSRASTAKIGRAHVCTPVTNAHLVCHSLLEKKKNPTHDSAHTLRSKHISVHITNSQYQHQIT